MTATLNAADLDVPAPDPQLLLATTLARGGTCRLGDCGLSALLNRSRPDDADH